MLLVADDERLVGKLIQEALEPIDLTPVFIDEAKKALKVINRLQPILAICGCGTV